jgi:hypothetical protein
MIKNIKKQFMSKEKSKAGFAILFAVLLASFLITLGISIFSISLKEIMITTSVRDSQIAYYIADSARECALYWDIKQGAFPACLNSDCTSVSTTTAPKITCNGKDTILNFNHPASSLIHSVTIQDFFQATSSISSPISDISIEKKLDLSIPTAPKIITTIKAYGHNTGIVGRRVERGLQQINN